MEHISAEEYRKMISGSLTKSKYHNQKTVVDDITFDSLAEANRYCELKALKAAGEIEGFGIQPSFIIDLCGTRYRPDFIVCDKDHCVWVEDVKGVETSIFKVKKRKWEQQYPWLPLILIR